VKLFASVLFSNCLPYDRTLSCCEKIKLLFIINSQFID